MLKQNRQSGLWRAHFGSLGGGWGANVVTDGEIIKAFEKKPDSLIVHWRQPKALIRFLLTV